MQTRENDCKCSYCHWIVDTISGWNPFDEIPNLGPECDPRSIIKEHRHILGTTEDPKSAITKIIQFA